MFKSIVNYYRIIRTWFWGLPIWKKAILSSLFGALGGSTVLGFFNKYALYYYALCQGIRIPFEGVEYLGLSISIVSFGILLVTLITSIVIYNLLRLMGRLFVGRVDTSQERKNEVLYRVYFVLFLFTTFASIIVYRLVKIHLDQNVSFDNKGLVGILSTLGIFILVCILIISLSKEDKERKITVIVLTFIGVITLTSSLFNQSVYSKFLKYMQYGGGVPLSVEYRKADNTQDEVSGELILRTNQFIFLKSPGDQILEVPIERVSKLEFKAQ